MENAAVARLFEEIADYMELGGENIFKIRAYRKAAEAIADLERPVEDLSESGELDTVEGMGSATIAKTKEFLATGKVRVLEALRAKYPPGLLDVLRVPGLGPKKVAQLHKDKGIDSIEKLVEAINSGALSGLSGFGPKTIANIQVGIQRLAEVSNRLPLADATRQAERLAAALGVDGAKVVVAGSLRRGADTVGNINLVAETADAESLVARFAALPSVVEVTQSSLEGSTGRVHPGVDVVLSCAPPVAFGSRLFFHTGSARHVEQAVARAAGLGIELDAFASEEELYRALGAPVIPPELREGTGEWDAVLAGQLPKLVEVSDLRGDLHAHSTWSDGTATILQMAQAARERGYEYLAITDHSKALAMANGLNAARLREQAHEIAEAEAQVPGLKILRGIECDIMRDGSMDLDDDILHELDIVVASVHSGFNFDEATQTERMIRAIEHPAVDIIAHPTGRVLGVRPPYEVNVKALIEAALATGTALEINASERLDLSDTNAFAARAAGVPLAIDTDAHSVRMYSNAVYGILTARRAWCTAADVLNTRSTAELLGWLKR